MVCSKSLINGFAAAYLVSCTSWRGGQEISLSAAPWKSLDKSVVSKQELALSSRGRRLRLKTDGILAIASAKGSWEGVEDHDGASVQIGTV